MGVSKVLAATAALQAIFSWALPTCLAAQPQAIQVHWHRYVVNGPFGDKSEQLTGHNSTVLEDKISLYRLKIWYSGKGNHFIQLSDALEYAICCQARLIIPGNRNFPVLPTRFDFSIDGGVMGREYKRPDSCLTHYSGDFWNRAKKLQLIPKTCNVPIAEALRFYAFGYPHLTKVAFKEDKKNGGACESNLEDALVIHIRSGDIFYARPHGPYKQPPVAFYRKIIGSKPWKRVIFVTSYKDEKEVNPVWSYFKDEKNRADFQSTTFEFRSSESYQDDFALMWCSQNFVAAFSSFSMMSIRTSPYLKEVYVSDDCEHWEGHCGYDNPNIKVHRLLLPDYLPGPWANSPEQRQQMLTYDINLIRER